MKLQACCKGVVPLLAVVLGGLNTTPESAAPPAGYYLVWADEFNGTSLDATKWDYWLLGNRRDAVNVTSAVAVGGGYLTITTYTSGGTHYTGMIATDGTFRSRYGYWESSLKWGDTNGMWSAFWMQSPTMGSWLTDPQVSGSEIDIAEHRYVDSGTNNIANKVQVNVHWNGYGSTAQSAGSGNVGSGLASGFHTYGFLWTPSSYGFSIDGSQVYNGGSSPVSHSTEWAILSSEVDDTSTKWAGYIPPGGYGGLASSTTRLTVDYVRYYAPTNVLFWTGASSVFWTNSGNWISNLQPTSVSDVTFSSLSGSLSNVLGRDYSVAGLVFLNLGNALSINGTNTLTVGADGIDMIAANHTVNLNAPLAVGANQTWLVGPNNPGNTLNINGSLSGAATLTKGSYGSVILNASNSFSGILNVDTSSTTSSDGTVRIAHPAALARVASPITIRNNNSGSSTLQLSAANGNIVVTQDLALNGRNSSVVAVENLSGSNTLAGNLTINVGGAQYWFQSDAGQLSLAGTFSSAATGTRTLTFMGNGNFALPGSIQNGSGIVGVVKTGPGTLSVTGTQTYTGPTTVSNGTLLVNGTLGSGALTVAAGGTLGGTGVIQGPVSIQASGLLAPGNPGNPGALTISNSLTLAGTTLLELKKAFRTNDMIRGLSTVTYGGALMVTNGGGVFASGDTFTLFQAGAFNGSFASMSLPPLAAGLAWNTNSLTNGILSVISTRVPQVTSLLPLLDGNVQLNGLGAAGANYQLFAATNLLSPMNWLLLANTTADTAGTFQFFDRTATNFAQRFYRVLGP